MPFADINGVKLYYETHGDGPPLLMLHGNGEDGGVFAAQTDEFARHYKVILADSRGHGRSGFARPITIPQFSKDMFALLDSLSVQKAHVVGFSDGGNVALAMAAQDHSRLRSLTAIGANLHPNGVLPWIQIPLTAWYACLSAAALFSKKADQKKAVIGLMMRLVLRPEQLKEVDTPALIIAGDRDIIKRKHTQLIACSLQNAQCVFLPDCGHFCIVSHPRQFNELALQFLKEHS